MVDKGEFFLKGYTYKQPITFPFGGQTIQLYANLINHEKLTRLKSEESEVSETGILKILGLNDKEKLRDIAVDIKNLLSIGLGKTIIFDRQTYWIGEAYETIEELMNKNENQGERIIPDFEIKNYLEQVLPNWVNYSKIQKDDIFTITDYLNQTRHGHIEDRILRTVQAWECAANYWVEEMELSEDLKELREKIKSTYKQWKIDKEYIDINGELGRRLTSPLDQEKLMLRLDKLIKVSGLITSKINLDLKRLKDLRDKVAHTGRIDITGREAIKFLQPGIKGLQLLLLKRIGYDGYVNGEKDGYVTRSKINEYFE